jgi:integrase
VKRNGKRKTRTASRAQSRLPPGRVHGPTDATSPATEAAGTPDRAEKIVAFSVANSPETTVQVVDVDRDKTIDIFKQAMESFDKTMVTVSGGALAVSITFLHDIAPNPSRWSLIPLAVGWGSLIGSLGSIIVSMPTGQKSIKVRLEGGDDTELANLTTKLNHWSVRGLLVGILGLAVFAGINMFTEKPTAPEPKPVVVQCVAHRNLRHLLLRQYRQYRQPCSRRFPHWFRRHQLRQSQPPERPAELLLGGTALLAYWARQGLARASVGQIRAYFGALMQFLRKRKQIVTAEWVKDVEMPRHFSTAQPPPRAILTDDEFTQFVTCEQVDLRLPCLAVMARFVSGMRTNDLHAWTWAHISFEAGTAWVTRPKTAKTSRAEQKPHELPAVALHFLRLWWMRCGRPEGSVPVFGLIRDHRKKAASGGKGERITYAASYAKRLRNALKTAGISRPELFKSTEVALRVDFHSFRRAYATALAEVDADGRLSMRLTGHKSMPTHNLYVMRTGTMKVPEAALLKVPLG